jgi:peptide/nickel transport system permease protein
VSFLLLHLAPGTFIDQLVASPDIPPSTIAKLEEQFGLNQPWYRQYSSWLSMAVRGDLGISMAFRQPVSRLLDDSVVYTASLALAAWLMALTGGLAFALLAALRPGGVVDRFLSSSALVLASVPTLVLAVVSLGLAAATGLVPVGGGSVSISSHAAWIDRLLDFVHHLLLPSVVLGVALGPLFFLQSRGALLESIPAGFAQAARSRGLNRWQVLFRHCLKSSLVPIFTFAGSSVGRVLNGAFLVEVVTGWPGMGRLAWSGLLARDYFLVLGILTFVTILMLFGNLMADLSVAAVDPRIRLERR